MLKAVQVFNRNQLLVEVLALELIVGAIAKDTLLLKLMHQDLFHLPMCQFAIVVKAKCLNSTVFILVQLDLMLYDLHACFKDTLVFDCLSNLNFSRASAS